MTADRTFPPEQVETRQHSAGARHTRWRRPMAVVAVAGLAAIGLVATPAQAQVVQCTDTRQNTTLQGTVLVPDGAACTLVNVMVIGDAEVGANADLFLEGTAIRAVTTGHDAFVSATGARISQGLTMNQSFGMEAFDTFIGGGVQVNGATTIDGTVLFTNGTHFVGNVTSTDGWTVLRDGQINGLLDTSGGRASDMFRMRIHGVSVDDARTGTVVCDTTSHGDFSVSLSRDVIQIGGPFPTPDCAGNKIAGSLAVTNNFAESIQISGNQITKDLICSGNTTVPVGAGNIVLGTTSDGCSNVGMATETNGTQALVPMPGDPAEEEAATEMERVSAVRAHIAERFMVEGTGAGTKLSNEPIAE